MIDPAEVSGRLDVIRNRIADAGGDVAAVTIVAVTKGLGADAVVAAAAAGLGDVGESYAQELEAKSVELGTGFEWPTVHFIGRLQRNKVRKLAGLVDLWQSVDRVSLAEEIARRDPGARVLVQVDVAATASQGGCSVGEVPGLIERARDLGLEVAGCMAIGAQGPPDEVRSSFETLRRVADEHHLAERSMGMSGDLEEAIRAGSTMVRIGTALLGERPPR